MIQRILVRGRRLAHFRRDAAHQHVNTTFWLTHISSNRTEIISHPKELQYFFGLERAIERGAQEAREVEAGPRGFLRTISTPTDASTFKPSTTIAILSRTMALYYRARESGKHQRQSSSAPALGNLAQAALASAGPPGQTYQARTPHPSTWNCNLLETNEGQIPSCLSPRAERPPICETGTRNRANTPVVQTVGTNRALETSLQLIPRKTSSFAGQPREVLNGVGRVNISEFGGLTVHGPRSIGAGSSGVAFKATTPEGVTVTVKLASRSYRSIDKIKEADRELVQEARLLRRLHSSGETHRNIISLLDAVINRGGKPDCELTSFARLPMSNALC